jgi:hydroxylamine dehydrogenase
MTRSSPLLLMPFALLLSVPARAEVPPESRPCVECHEERSTALVEEWDHSRHAAAEVGCYDCHQAQKGQPGAWQHRGVWISTLVTPRACAVCHDKEYSEFNASHHARAGEILASLDNVLAERVCGMPGNIADAVNGCWQCHGGIVRFERDAKGGIVRSGPEGMPVLASDTWPNSGIGRLNPDGSRGACNACHSRHDFSAKVARSPESCGKCHLGPDHPQSEIYDESKHGIAFRANWDRMALDAEEWVLGREYSAAPTCATCHMGGYLSLEGELVGNSHNVGDRISWTLRPVVSTRLNRVVFADGFLEDYPESRALPEVGDTVLTQEKLLENDVMKTCDVRRQVAGVTTWEDRRAGMKAVCANCHAGTHVDNFYKQYDDLVVLYNTKFARPSSEMMDALQRDRALDPRSPFGTTLQWSYYELWHHEGRRARHGAAMMGPDYTHWHGMYEVAKRFYTEFLPQVVETARGRSAELGDTYQVRVDSLLAGPEHLWLKGLDPGQIDEMKKAYQQRYQRNP